MINEQEFIKLAHNYKEQLSGKTILTKNVKIVFSDVDHDVRRIRSRHRSTNYVSLIRLDQELDTSPRRNQKFSTSNLLDFHRCSIKELSAQDLVEIKRAFDDAASTVSGDAIRALLELGIPDVASEIISPKNNATGIGVLKSCVNIVYMKAISILEDIRKNYELDLEILLYNLKTEDDFIQAEKIISASKNKIDITRKYIPLQAAITFSVGRSLYTHSINSYSSMVDFTCTIAKGYQLIQKDLENGLLKELESIHKIGSSVRISAAERGGTFSGPTDIRRVLFTDSSTSKDMELSNG